MTRMTLKQIREIAKRAKAIDLTGSFDIPYIEPVLYSVGVYGISSVLAVGRGYDNNWYIIKRSSNLFKVV